MKDIKTLQDNILESELKLEEMKKDLSYLISEEKSLDMEYESLRNQLLVYVITQKPSLKNLKENFRVNKNHF